MCQFTIAIVYYEFSGVFHSENKNIIYVLRFWKTILLTNRDKVVDLNGTNVFPKLN